MSMAERQGLIVERDLAINERACEWTVRAISALQHCSYHNINGTEPVNDIETLGFAIY